MKIKQILSLILGLIFVFGGNGYAQEQDAKTMLTPETKTLVWKGCGITRKAFMSEAAARFKEKTGIEFKIVGGGATLGIRTAIAGSVDIGGTCRHTLPGIFSEENGGYLTHVAWDAIVFITHPDNPIESITEAQAKDIFTGKITNWKELGGEDQVIELVYRDQTEKGNYSGVGHMLRMMMFENPEALFKEKALSFRDSGKVEKHVEKSLWSFAATGISSAKKRNVNVLALNGRAPSKENIGSGEYGYYRPLFLVTQEIPKDEVKVFMEWLLSPEGQEVISKQGTVNLAEGKILKEKYTFWNMSKDLVLNF